MFHLDVQLARDALLVHGPLAHRLGVHQLRNELETAAFRRLFPEQFHEVSGRVRERGREGCLYLSLIHI